MNSSVNKKQGFRVEDGVIYCNEHNGKKLVNFCIDHNKALCSLCFKDHANHKLEMLENIASELLRIITNMYEDSTEFSDALDNSLEFKLKLLQQRKGITKEFFSLTRQEIDRIEQEFNDRFEKECKTFEVQAKELSYDAAQMKEVFDKIHTLTGIHKDNYNNENFASLYFAKREILDAQAMYKKNKEDLLKKQGNYETDYEAMFNISDLREYLKGFVDTNLLKIKQKGTRMYEIDSASKEMTVYDVKNMSVKTVVLDIHEEEMPVWPPYIETRSGKIYLIGGNLGSSSSNRVYELIEHRNELERREDMAFERQAVGIAALGDTSIFVVGGYNCKTNKWLSSCERYDIADDKWTQISELNESRSSNSVCVFAKQHLYTFGGFNLINGVETYLHTIEKYSIEKDIWKIVDVKTCNKMLPLHSVGTITLDRDRILIFGGSDGSGHIHNDAFIFKPHKKKFYKIKKLRTADIFKFHHYCVYENKVYSLGRDNIHVYSTDTQTWDAYNKGFKQLEDVKELQQQAQ